MGGSRKKKAAPLSPADASAASATFSSSSSSSAAPTSPTTSTDSSFSPLTATLPSTVHSLYQCPVLFTIPLPSDCTLSSIVCSYGFFRLPPNTWIPSNSRLHRITPLAAAGGVTVCDAGAIPNGAFMRALRFGDREEDAIFVAVTQEAVVIEEKEEKEEKAQRVAADVQPVESREELEAEALLTYHANQHIVVRAIQPPYSLLSALPASADKPLDYTFTLSPAALTRILQQVCRMLRLSPLPTPTLPNPYHRFYRLLPTARQRGFARLFRSPTSFEDLLKTVSLCNINWAGTIAMNGAFSRLVGLGRDYAVEVEVLGPTAKEAVAAVRSVERSESMGRSAMSEVMRSGQQTVGADGGGVHHRITLGTFPSPYELAAMPDAELREKCRVGYRSQRIIRLAHRFAHERLDQHLTALLTPDTPTGEVYKFLLSLDGFGPFAAANALAMLGRFDSHPFDSETVRHMREHHKFDTAFHLTSDAVLRHAREHYSAERYGEFVFLVYWFELWENYEARVRCRAEEWTQDAFSSFSNGGKKTKQQEAAEGGQATAELSHARRVAQQTLERKRKGLTAAAFNARRKKPATQATEAAREESANKENELPSAEEGDEQQQQRGEEQRAGESGGSAEVGGAGKRRSGRTLKDMMQSRKRATPGKAAVEPLDTGEGRRVTRAAAKRQSAELVE